jgi:hypothetical protein
MEQLVPVIMALVVEVGVLGPWVLVVAVVLVLVLA